MVAPATPSTKLERSPSDRRCSLTIRRRSVMDPIFSQVVGHVSCTSFLGPPGHIMPRATVPAAPREARGFSHIFRIMFVNHGEIHALKGIDARVIRRPGALRVSYRKAARTPPGPRA